MMCRVVYALVQFSFCFAFALCVGLIVAPELEKHGYGQAR